MSPLLLLAVALLLWASDTSWQSCLGDTLPVLGGLPLFLYLLRGEWKGFHESPTYTRGQNTTGTLALTIAGSVLVLCGLIAQLLFVGALGWTVLLWSYLAPRLPVTSRSRVVAHLPLALLSFPWLITEGTLLGWFFRLSGAAATATLFRVLGFGVVRHGTHLIIGGVPVSVEAPCSGLNLLQSLLLVGLFLAAKSGALRTPRQLPWLMAALFTAVWCANTLRIMAICGLGLVVGIKQAQTPLLHDGLGLGVFIAMFAVWRSISGRFATVPENVSR